MKKIFNILNLDCANCAAKMEELASKVNGVNKVSFNFFTSKLTLDAQDELFENALDEIIKLCKKIEPDLEIEIN